MFYVQAMPDGKRMIAEREVMGHSNAMAFCWFPSGKIDADTVVWMAQTLDGDLDEFIASECCCAKAARGT